MRRLGWADLYGPEAYFDNSATTRPRPEVIAAVTGVLQEEYGNPSSLHSKGAAAERLLRSCRRETAQALGVRAEEIVFTSGGTESNNLAILGLARAKAAQGRHIITSKVEHPATLEACRRLEEEGFEVSYLDVDPAGRLDPARVAAALRPDTVLITLMHVNNEVGSVTDLGALDALPRRPDGLPYLHVDAVQSAGRILARPFPGRIDALSLSGHKLHGLKGCGVLYVRRGLPLMPLILGGGQEEGLRSGTENLPGIAALATALRLAVAEQAEASARLLMLRRRFLEGLASSGLDFALNGPAEPPFAPHIVNLSFRGVKAETLLHALADHRVFVSSGSACSARSARPSHVLEAMGLSPERVEGALRFSFSPFNQERHVEQALKALAEAVPRLQRVRGGTRGSGRGRKKG